MSEVLTGERGGAGGEGLVARSGRALGAVAVPWVTARLIVVGALALAHLVVSRTDPARAGVRARVGQGLLGWDAGFYLGIARHGYQALGQQTLRFFPLYPLTGRALGALGLGDKVALVAIANAGAFVGTALFYVLARRETGDERLARRAAWFLCVAPPAFTLVMGYAEGLLLVCTAGCLLAVRPAAGRRPAWWWAAAAAYAGALTRPLGVLLVVPVAVEALRWWARSGRRSRVASVVAVVAPLAGLGTFLGWAGSTFGDPLLPLRVQTQSSHHGGFSDPLRTLAHDAAGVAQHHFGTALHVPWVVVVVALLVVCWFRLPASFSAFATAVVLVALSGSNLDSFERYALSAVPLVLAAASVTARPQVERAVLALAAAGLAGYALLAFLNLSVP